jgi:hypothetical protein
MHGGVLLFYNLLLFALALVILHSSVHATSQID